jgi:hypothetical protein
VSSVAYRAEPPSPGWLWAAGGLLVGWIVAGFATGGLYVFAESVGAISRTYPSLNDWTTPNNGVAINEWPYPDGGLWGALTNVAVVVLVVLLTTVATSWWMRRSYERFSEGRLSLVLLFTGWVPLKAGGPVGGFFGFLVAVVLIRYWVARHEDHLPNRTAIILVAALAGVIAVYGVLHPLWTVDVIPQGTPHARAATIVIHNAGRVPVRVDGFTVPPAFDIAQAGGFTPLSGRLNAQHRPLRFPARSERFLVLSLPQGCGTPVLRIKVRYHVFGLPLSQAVPARVSLGGNC